MRELVTQMLEALEKLSDTEQTYAALDKADAAIKAAREYLTTEPSGGRAEFIKKLRGIENRHLKIERKVPLDMLEFYLSATLALHDAANMLEADAQPKDKGPWCAGMTKDARVYVQSDDFKRDARLYVNGDFATKNEEYLYACALARHLNATAETMSANSQQAKQVPKND